MQTILGENDTWNHYHSLWNCFEESRNKKALKGNGGGVVSMGDQWETLLYLCLVGQSLEKWFSLRSLQEVLSKIMHHYFPLCLTLALLVANSPPRMGFFITDCSHTDAKASWLYILRNCISNKNFPLFNFFAPLRYPEQLILSPNCWENWSRGLVFSLTALCSDH